MPSMQERDKMTQPNQSSDKLLILMEKMSELDEPARLQDIARMAKMSPSTALRFLTALQRRDYAAQDIDTGRYYLTFKLCGLADNISSRLGIRNIALPFLKSIARTFSEATNLSVENDKSVMYIEVVPGPRKTLMTLQRIGHIAPMYCTAVGKILLLNYSREQLDNLMAQGMPPLTEHTITTPEKLREELEWIGANGYAFDNEECETGARCVAVPVRDFSGRIVAGVSVSGPAIRMTDEHIREHLPYLLEAAEQVSLRLGWSPETEQRTVCV